VEEEEEEEEEEEVDSAADGAAGFSRSESIRASTWSSPARVEGHQRDRAVLAWHMYSWPSSSCWWSCLCIGLCPGVTIVVSAAGIGGGGGAE
jgi:hypothetical protein